MGKVGESFLKFRREGKKGLIPFIVAGHPHLEQLAPLLRALDSVAPVAIEVGIPFSDPIADGPVISGAMHRVLQDGVGLREILAEIKQARGSIVAPLIAMVSNSIVHAGGGEMFIRMGVDHGFDGFIIPDADADATDGLSQCCAGLGVSLSLLAAPKTDPQRLAQIVGKTQGFLYLLARAGITGGSVGLADVSERVQVIRAISDVPIAVGFGISTAGDVKSATRDADAAIVGSAFIREIDSHPGQPIPSVRRLAEQLAEGLVRR